MSSDREYVVDNLEAVKLAMSYLSGKTKDQFLFLENPNVN